jgi:hypothetical protein
MLASGSGRSNLMGWSQERSEGDVRVSIDGGAEPALLGLFRRPLLRALGRRSGSFDVRLRRGRSADEALVLIEAKGRTLTLPLFFPSVGSLQQEEIYGTLCNVFEAMGPAFPLRPN